jgi:hypothetical protein
MRCRPQIERGFGDAWRVAMKTLARRFGYTAASIVRYRDRIAQQKAAIASRRSSQRNEESEGTSAIWHISDRLLLCQEARPLARTHDFKNQPK